MKKAFVWLTLVVAVLFAGAYAWRWHLIQELRKPVLAGLNDPDSAKFRNEKFVGPWTFAHGNLCGEVNAKNMMGGYVGYEGFTVMGFPEKEGGESAMVFDDNHLCDADDLDLPWWWLRW
ncbi:hypothetical protein [Kerstersia gyiorum]|uniref:hypothetical protein n=1 Tax=Kerstersia gyiorum TaxID=206506 RepID=UPI000838B443|nr:hypothetical protein [Kerstersia gyiorum]